MGKLSSHSLKFIIASSGQIEDDKILTQLRKIEKLPGEKKKIVKELLDAFIFKADLQKQLAS